MSGKGGNFSWQTCWDASQRAYERCMKEHGITVEPAKRPKLPPRPSRKDGDVPSRKNDDARPTYPLTTVKDNDGSTKRKLPSNLQAPNASVSPKDGDRLPTPTPKPRKKFDTN